MKRFEYKVFDIDTVKQPEEEFINKIDNQQDTLLTIFLGDSLLSSGVSCLMDSGYIKLKKVFTPGAQITIKGICTGYLMDVELNRCVVE